MPKIDIKNRKQLILSGMFLSKFSKEGVRKLGFSTFKETFNALGYALGGKPMSIKNYRDEFDPFFDNTRKGWHGREIREHVSEIYERYRDLKLDEFATIIAEFLIPNYRKKLEIEKSLNIEPDSGFIKRVATGKAAENYFLSHYRAHFSECSILDTREFGCGFDFRIDSKSSSFCVEVKGLGENRGSFLLTQKEFEMASKIGQNYCLYIVRNLKEKPSELIFYNPLEHFKLKQLSKHLVQIFYQGEI